MPQTTQTVTPAQAAAQASLVSGLPQAFTLALIQAEQNAGQLAITNNPFDIVRGWLDQTGFGSIFVSPWNSAGVAITSDPFGAIASWWQGLTTFTNYTTFRLHLMQGQSVRTLLTDLSKAGYAGGSQTWVDNVARLYEQNSGKSADSGFGQITVIPPLPLPNPQPSPTPAPAPTTTPDPTKLTVVKSTDPVFGGLIDAVNSFQAGVLSIVLSVEKFFWIVIGLVIVALGIYVLVQGR